MHVPLLNSTLRRRVLSNTLVVASFGSTVFNNYAVLEGGLAYLEFAQGKNLISTYLARASLSVVLTGGTDRLNAIEPFWALITKSISNIYSFFVQPSIASFGFVELGLNSVFFDFNSDIDETYVNPRIIAPVLYSIEGDSVSEAKLNFIVKVYQGHHGDRGASNAHMILPAYGLYEDDLFYVSARGSLESSGFLLTPPSGARAHWQILLAIWGYYSRTHTYSFIADYFSSLGRYERVSSVLPLLRIGLSPVILLNRGSLCPFFFFMVMLDGSYYVQSNNNFYLADPVSRASRNMALASSRFRLSRELIFL